MGSIREKNQGLKISCQNLFKKQNAVKSGAEPEKNLEMEVIVESESWNLNWK